MENSKPNKVDQHMNSHGMKTIEKGGNSDHTCRWPGWSAWNKIVLFRCASVRGNHTEINTEVGSWLLTVHDGDHAVELRVSSLVLVVHERKFEVRGFLDLRLRVWAFFELTDEFEAFAGVDFEFMRIGSFAVVGLR
jgi:hypothetical protein